MNNQTVDLFGWDTAFAVRIGELNKEIIKQKKWPTGFKLDWPKYNATCQVTFDAWKLCPGGDGEQVVMELPMKNVNCHQGDSISGKNLEAVAEVKVRLNFIPTGEKNALKVSSKEYEDTDPFTIESLLITGHPNDTELVNTLTTFLKTWLTSNLNTFAHIFALVDLNRTADKDQFQWMQPTAQEYAYTDIGDSDGALGVICMTSGRDPGSQAQQLSAYLIPDGTTSTLGISMERLLSNLFLPMLPNVFYGTNISDFKVNLEENRIDLATKLPKFSTKHMLYRITDKSTVLNLSWTAVKHALQQANLLQGEGKAELEKLEHLYKKLGFLHHYKLVDFSLQIKGQEVVFDATCCSKPFPGIQSFCKVSRTMKAQATHGKNGPGIKFVDAKNPVTSHWKKTSDGFVITEIMTAMIILVVGVALAFLTGGAAIIPMLAFTVGLAGAVPAAGTILGAIDKDNAPALTLAASDATAPIKWSDEKDFELNKVELKESLLMIGQLMPNPAKTT